MHASSGDLSPIIREILFVDDGSTDATPEVLRKFLKSSDGFGATEIRVVTLPQNQGRYRARLAGARAATGSQLLFLDTRLQVGEKFFSNLAQIASQYSCAQGVVDIDTQRSVYALYWDRSHRFLFRKHYRDTQTPLTLTQENFDQYLKGTGVFWVNRDVFIRTCESFGSENLLSDDTYLMKEILKSTPITIHPDLRILWYPRETAFDFLARLISRGPGTVEYHVYQHRGWIFKWILAGILGLIAWLIAVFWFPQWAGGALLAVLAIVPLSAGLFARSFGEWIKIAPLHLAAFLAFGSGILYGLIKARRQSS
jgi:glycosyltransferase involved in cell wall biosynthesis